MFSYEIRTFERRWHSSLIMFAICPNDPAAIMVARDFARKGQAVEVWRDDRLVYRSGLKQERAKEKSGGSKPAKRFGFSLFLRKDR